jgi:hypothetical protein
MVSDFFAYFCTPISTVLAHVLRCSAHIVMMNILSRTNGFI